MDMLDVSVTLIVKAPNQQIEDQTIKCDTTWSIRKLKGYLEEVYPSKPRTEDQKLIYSGQLLPDTVILKDVLRQYEGQETHTVHLVCTASRDSMKRTIPVATRPSTTRMSETRAESTTTVPNDASSQSATNADSLDGIRQRLSAANVPPPSVSHQYNAGYPASDPRAVWTAAMAQPYPGGYDPNQMAQQLMYMQQAYAQYMTNYMQMMAANAGAPPMPGSLAPPTQPVPEAPADNHREQPDPQPDENPNILDGEEEEGRGNRDWLDWFYILSRVMVLFSIVYFYSSPTRFIIVSALGVMMYLYQVGFFRAQMLQGGPDVPDNNNHAGGARAVDNHNLRNNQEAGDAEEDSDHDETTDTEAGNEARDPVPPVDERLPFHIVAWTFFSTFFASLIPEQPGV